MAKPTLSQVHIDVALTNISIGYTPGQYIWNQVLPELPVEKVTGKYFIYTKADWLRREAALRAPGARAARGDYGQSTGSYTCVERAIAKQVPDEIVENADMPLRPLEDGTRWVTEQIYSEVENDVADLVFGTGWSSSATPSPTWDNDTSTPITDIQTAMNSIVSTIGREANVGVIGRGAWRYLLDHPDILDRIKFSAGPTSPAVVNAAAIAALAGLEKLLIGTAIEDTAAEGASSSLAYLWGNHMAVMFLPMRASLITPAAGYTFTYKTREISRFREEQERADVIEARMSWDSVLTATDAGYLLKSVA